ncbi:hypothetical protein A2690_03450 [Candidatus Roizmanbacteria bacterium RIFCSPHIGHO2_01_FULL_39_12b]|uniref:DedA family protein n=1 Tax=Candidatus Roizmanbacteria bacterium RIFCSPHIGHO2_01_FULL_39_12b TaxID=1802030 RepID=A0A1F7GEC1_9BACT|nr:MAG: hypothetical protein A2690_03450 [Candidatus Roizmanbacteria bacterium RIFCSPHIGHO2_01_FULL_39_12b]OGK47330.1 MAG: hypothetical protein A3B46_02235 [Candidatus Roizmanbacteria bacterium RIFCSPLOWO2_01_FULL_39_19]
MNFLDAIPLIFKKRLKSFKYKNLTLLLFSFIIALLLYKNESFHSFLIHLGNLGYVGALIAGFLFVSTFTVATGTLILLVLAEQLSAVEIGIVAGLGAVLGDLIIFHFVQDNLIDEVKLIYLQFGGGHIVKVLHTKYFSWTLPVIGAILIASPLPDEIGISLLGLSKMNPYEFLLLSFILNSIGIFLIVTGSVFIKP